MIVRAKSVYSILVAITDSYRPKHRGLSVDPERIHAE
jgi:hypothetical protein